MIKRIYILFLLFVFCSCSKKYDYTCTVQIDRNTEQVFNFHGTESEARQIEAENSTTEFICRCTAR